MKSYILSLGSNIGDSVGYLKSALSLLQERGVAVVEHSSMYKTSPVDYHNQSDFVNMVAWVNGADNPFDLLDIIGDVERILKRERHIEKGPRTVDIDIIAADGVTMEHPRLTIPHPRAQARRFVMQPIWELAERDSSSDFVKKTASWDYFFPGKQSIEKMEE